jgi:hypothetical protein
MPATTSIDERGECRIVEARPLKSSCRSEPGTWRCQERELNCGGPPRDSHVLCPARSRTPAYMRGTSPSHPWVGEHR